MSHNKRLGTGTVIGIGVGIVVLLAVVTGIAYWTWRSRRGRHDRQELDSNPTSTAPTPPYPKHRKHLLNESSRAELPASSTPAELSSVELVELEANPSSHLLEHKHAPPVTPSTQYPPRSQYQFQEYEMSTEPQTGRTVPPVSDRPSYSAYTASSYQPAATT